MNTLAHHDIGEETIDLLARIDIYGALACMCVARVAKLPVDEHIRKVTHLTSTRQSAATP